MTCADIADTMDAHMSNTGYSTMMFDTSMLLATSVGSADTIDDLAVNWKFTMGPKGRKVITFSYDDDSSWEYRHDYENYVEKFRVMYIDSTKGNRYF